MESIYNLLQSPLFSISGPIGMFLCIVFFWTRSSLGLSSE